MNLDLDKSIELFEEFKQNFYIKCDTKGEVQNAISEFNEYANSKYLK